MIHYAYRYDSAFVIASLLISMLSTFVMLSLAQRVRAGDNGMTRGLCVGGSIAMGTGIWSVHFFGTMAHSLPIALDYSPFLIFLSWVAGVASCGVVLWAVSRDVLTPRRLIAGALSMGAGICVVHVTGMAAVVMAPGNVWGYWLVADSVPIVVGALGGSLVASFWLNGAVNRRGSVYQVAAASITGLAMTGMHHTVMAAAGFPADSVRVGADALSGGNLGTLAILASLMLLALTLIASTFDARVVRRILCVGRSLRHSNGRLERQAEQLSQAEEAALIGSGETDLCTGVVTVSPGLSRVFREAPASGAVPPDWLIDRVPAEDRQPVQLMRESVTTDESFAFEHRIVQHDDSIRTVLDGGRIELAQDGTPLRMHTTLHDIALRREAEQSIFDRANVDVATGMPNRNALLNRLSEAMLVARLEQREICLLVIEFRLASEGPGYAAGDDLFRVVAQRLLDVAPGADTVAHLGAGEFALLLCSPGDSGEAAAQCVARSILRNVCNPLHIGVTEIFASAAVGVAVFPNDGNSAAELLDRAGASAQLARQQSGNCICFYTAEANARDTVGMSIEAALPRAIERDEIYLCYQPQVDLDTGRIVGVEALARWKESVRGEISPAEFIPLAEKTGLIIPIGEWVLHRACLDSMRWQAEGLTPVRIGVNLSMVQLQHPDIVARIRAILQETGLDPHYLGIEITESMLNDQVEKVTRTLSELKAMGIEIALDDFGTGYSNLSYLSELPIDVIKIDRSLVCDVTAPAQDVSITRAIIDLGHSLNMKVLAEGVENEGQLALLTANFCDQVQGYFFSQPVRADDIATMLREDKRLPAHLLEREARGRTLLMVDEEENVIASLRRLLRSDGHYILSASSGAQALQQLVENHGDIIICNERMPGTTGVEFLRLVKKLRPDTVCLVMSGTTDLQSITAATDEVPVHKFLTEPWDEQGLRSQVNESFRQKELSDENHELGVRLQTANGEVAALNLRMQKMIQTQLERIERDEVRLLNVSELLEGIPALLIGFDMEGVVAYLNADAQDLFAFEESPIGRDAAEALSPELVQIWRASDGAHVGVVFGGRYFQVTCRALGSEAHQRGKLMMLIPQAAPGRMH